MKPSSLIAGQSVRMALQESTVLMMACLFVVLVMLSAWLGWQATDTVNSIYMDAADFLASSGKPVPSNPVLDVSPLALLRNMSVYVVLIGCLSAIVIGNRLVVMDRKAGVLPLMASRPITRQTYAAGKMMALGQLLLGLLGVAIVVAIFAMIALPAAVITPAQWLQLCGFFALSALYMAIFGLIALAATAASRSESVGLLVPVTIWLAVTFILPALTLNLTPTAVLNPISAMAVPPDTGFFRGTSFILGPISLAESYGALSAGLLEFRPAEWAPRAMIPPLTSLVLALGTAGFFARKALISINTTLESYDA